MRLENLYQFLVLFILVGIWALTSILNRDTRPLPPRPGRREPDERSGPEPRPVLRENATPSGGAMRPRDPRTARSIPSAFERPASPSPSPSPDDAIVFSEVRSNRPRPAAERPAAPRPTKPAQNRRGSKARGAETPSPRGRSAPDKPRELTQEIANSRVQLSYKPLELTPLYSQLTPLRTLSLPSSDLGFTHTPTSEPVSTINAHAMRLALADPARLREIFVWNELMQPPLALRQGFFRRR